MTYDYFIQFLTQYDTDQIPKGAVTFRTALQVGDVIQLEEDGEYHLVRLITHSPAGATLHLSGKGQNIADLLLCEPEFTDLDFRCDASQPVDVIRLWQQMSR
ncbi:hypothetical protein [Pseudaeromonas paramecii]|uniref:Uncharacterized protein n=1 Tax=Pseudaeromonas paramecii TaxID=2138166 RepID=A0ABP8PVR5_9GAMM